MARPSLRSGAVRVRVPATSANLGPGFDALGLALSLHDEVVVRVAGAGLAVDVTGESAGSLPLTERHLVVRSLRAGFDALGGQPPGLELHCVNRIPHSRGLGSSAAAIVAGVLAARALVADGTDRLDDAAVLRLAAALEGHPDNVAACLLGGFTTAWLGPDGARAVSVVPDPRVRPVAFVPAQRASTAAARGLLPPVVPHADAAYTAGRAALLVHAMTREPGLLLCATEDRLHQAHRAPAMPASLRLVDRLRSDGVPAVLSGAGPTVLAFAGERADLAGYASAGWDAVHLAVDAAGAVATPFSS